LGKKKSKKKSSIFDDLKKDLPKSKSVGYNALKNLTLNSENVLGDFTKDLIKKDSPISEKMALIQSLEGVALAEVVKSFEAGTRDPDRLIASNQLLSISKSLKATIKEKHNLELQEVVDFTNPKYSKSFSFLLELFVKVLSDIALEGSVILKVVDALTVATEGFEERLNHLFKDVPSYKVKEVKNPFIQETKAEVLDYIDIDIEESREDRRKRRREARRKKS
jgi:hypothetical protein